MEPIRLRGSVTIGDREYTVQEITVQEVLNLISGSVFLSDAKEEKEKTPTQIAMERVGVEFLSEYIGLGQDLKKILELSAVDFGLKDLIPLAPSSIKKVIDKFKEVNSDFLGLLKTLGVTEALLEVREATLSSFSKKLVDLLKLDT